MTTRREIIELVGRCLALQHDRADFTALRARLLSDPGAWEGVTRFALDEGLVLALEQSLRDKGLLVSDFLPSDSGLVGPDHGLRALAAVFGERRQVLAEHLGSIIERLNRAGIEPILIKGAQSLVTGEPPWRHLRDFDFLVPGKAQEAQAELIAMGFSVLQTDAAERLRRHHLPPLVRDDFPGLVEVHRRGGNHYFRNHFRTRELASESELRVSGTGRYRLLPQPIHVLYSLIHHHVGHSGDARGSISIKGLYEFAWEVARMTGAERDALQSRANQNPRLSAALDAWLAAAADLFRMPVERPFAVRPDAVRRWHATRDRLDLPRPWYKYPGYPDEVRMALAHARVRAAPLGAHAPGRLLMRLKVLRSFLPTS